MKSLQKGLVSTRQASESKPGIERREYTSRRRPHGALSILGLGPGATKQEIQKAIIDGVKEALACQKQAKSQQARGAATKRLALFEEIREQFRTEPNSTDRVQRCRARQSKKEKQITVAKDVCRRKFHDVGARGDCGIDVKRGDEVSCRGVVGVVDCISPSNASNGIASATVIVKRTKQQLRSDRRLAKFAAIPREALIAAGRK